MSNNLKNLCKKCNAAISTDYTEPTKAQIIERNLCFFCNFWTNILASPKVIVKREDGTIHHYTIGSEPSGNKHQMLGFGGRKFIIEFFNKMGEPVTTHNLWHQGEVPAHFHDQFIPNAHFLK